MQPAAPGANLGSMGSISEITSAALPPAMAARLARMKQAASAPRPNLRGSAWNNTPAAHRPAAAAAQATSTPAAAHKQTAAVHMPAAVTAAAVRGQATAAGTTKHTDDTVHAYTRTYPTSSHAANEQLAHQAAIQSAGAADEHSLPRGDSPAWPDREPGGSMRPDAGASAAAQHATAVGRDAAMVSKARGEAAEHGALADVTLYLKRPQVRL